jgi:D-amino-acid dehydrogenase
MKIVIVGGGVTGLFCAHYLIRDNHQVSIIERSMTGSVTSIYNAGLLTPSLAPTPRMGLRKILSPYFGREQAVYISPRQILRNTWWFWTGVRKGLTGYEDKIVEMGRSSLKLYKEFFAEVGLRPDVIEGVAALHVNEEDARKTQTTQGGKLLDGASINRMGYRGFRGGVLFEEELSINPSKLYNSLWDTVFAHDSAELIVGDDVKLDSMHGNNAQVSVDRETISCDIIILTAGSWSRELCSQLGYNPQILPARGLVILFDTGGEEIVTTPVVLEDYGIGLAQHDSSTLRLTGFFEMVGFRKDFSEHRKKWVLDRFKKHVVKSDRVRIAEEGVGFRPCTPDQLPVIGRVPGYQNIYVASGNCRLGVTLAPATANIIKMMISGTGAAAGSPSPSRSLWYDPSRFAS